VTVNVLAASGPRPTSQSRQRHSPRARRRARETGVDLDRILPTGRPTPLSCVVEADVTAFVGALPGALVSHVAAAAVAALRGYPQLNGGERAVRLGIDVDFGSGAAAVVLADAGDLNHAGLERRLGEQSVSEPVGRVAADDPATGTFTVTDAGARGILSATPALAPGQTGHLVLGAPVERAVVVSGADGERAIAIRSMAHLALAYDAERVDDVAAVGFLRQVKDALVRHDETRE
jgi:pyruvate dehydrogenase E2 component (dihydrolipoamide acetyltransferase)